jgi:hypothetical protein
MEGSDRPTPAAAAAVRGRTERGGATERRGTVGVIGEPKREIFIPPPSEAPPAKTVPAPAVEPEAPVPRAPEPVGS